VGERTVAREPVGDKDNSVVSGRTPGCASVRRMVGEPRLPRLGRGGGRVGVCRLAGDGREGRYRLRGRLDQGVRSASTPLPADGVDRLDQLVRKALPYEADSASIRSLLNEWIWAHREAVARPGGFSLGRFPVSVVGAVRSALDDLDVSYFGAPVEVSDRPLPVMLLIDDEDYLIAEDFDVDVPDFEHDSAWVSAAGAAVDPRLRSARPDELPREYPGR
jgi:hypothetical protein